MRDNHLIKKIYFSIKLLTNVNGLLANGRGLLTNVHGLMTNDHGLPARGTVESVESARNPCMCVLCPNLSG